MHQNQQHALEEKYTVKTIYHKTLIARNSIFKIIGLMQSHLVLSVVYQIFRHMNKLKLPVMIDGCYLSMINTKLLHIHISSFFYLKIEDLCLYRLSQNAIKINLQLFLLLVLFFATIIVLIGLMIQLRLRPVFDFHSFLNLGTFKLLDFTVLFLYYLDTVFFEST